MNIPDNLLNQMNSVHPNAIKWLTREELENLQITGHDPVYADQKDSVKAKRLKISKQELYSRQRKSSQIQSVCLEKIADLEAFTQCQAEWKKWKVLWLGGDD